MFSAQYQIDKSRKLQVLLQIFLLKYYNVDSLASTFFCPSIVFQRTQKRLHKSSRFFCNTNGTRSLTRPTSVHELRPGDIDVIGGIGDSLTVGTGSFSYILPQLVVDHRGVSWTIGINLFNYCL